MKPEELKKGRVYEAAFRGRYGRTRVTYLGEKHGGNEDRYYFYDGICGYRELADVPDRPSEKMNLMHLTEKDVDRFIK